jgi:hypothetical protein
VAHCPVRCSPREDSVLGLLGGHLSPKRSRSAQEWRLAPTSRDLFYRLDLAIPHQKGAIKIVNGGANVTRKEIKRVSDLRTCRTFRDLHRKMFFTGRQRREFRMPYDGTRGHAGIG